MSIVCIVSGFVVIFYLKDFFGAVLSGFLCVFGLVFSYCELFTIRLCTVGVSVVIPQFVLSSKIFCVSSDF